MQQSQENHQNDHLTMSLEIPTYPTIRLSDNKCMNFVSGCNVNSQQRDQYISDERNLKTGVIKRGLVRIQGEKDSARWNKSILPRFKVCVLKNLQLMDDASIFFIDFV